MLTKPEILRQAATNIASGRTYDWDFSDCCQVAHMVQVIQDITRGRMCTPFPHWHLVYDDPRYARNPHIMALKEAGFTLDEILHVEFLIGHEAFGIFPWADTIVYSCKSTVVAYMFALYREYRKDEIRKEARNKYISPCSEIMLPSISNDAN